MADRRVIGLALIGVGIFLHRTAVHSTAFPRAVSAGAERMAGQLRGVLEFAQSLDREGLSPEERQALMNAYMRGQREGAALPSVLAAVR